MNDAIQIDGLQKSYGTHAVLRRVDLRVRRGEIFALLGVNGAGKTTALECVEGLSKPDGGRIAVNGKMGIQLQSASLPAHIRAMEAVRLFAKWRKAAPDPALLAALGIDSLGKRPYFQLSTGQKRRLHLALALLGDPDILFLDEPTAGLDVEGRVSLHAQIRRLRARGKTILLASHDMAEVESLCDRIAILVDGAIAFVGTAGELGDRVGRRYNITLQTGAGTETYESDDIGDTLLALLARCKEQGTILSDIQVNRGSPEQHFMKIAKGE